MGGSPGHVFMGRESQSEGCGFEFQYHRLDIPSHYFVVKIVCLKKTKKLKRGWGWPI